MKLTGSVPGKNASTASDAPWSSNRDNIAYLLTVPELVKHWMQLGVTEQYTRLLDIYKIGVPNFAGAPPGVDLHQFDSQISLTDFPSLYALQDAVETYLKARVDAKNKNESNIGSGTAKAPPSAASAADKAAEQDYSDFKTKIGGKLVELIPKDGKVWPIRGKLMELVLGTSDTRKLYEENGFADHWVAKLNEWKWKNEATLAALRKQGEEAAAASASLDDPPAKTTTTSGAASDSDVSATRSQYTGNEPLETEEQIRELFTIEIIYTDKKTGRKTAHKYLQAAGAVLIFRLRHGKDGGIKTRLVQLAYNEWALCEAEVYLYGQLVSSGVALITREEAKRAGYRYVQMASTHAVRRALAAFGIGTEELIADDESDAAIIDSRAIELGEETNVNQ